MSRAGRCLRGWWAGISWPGDPTAGVPEWKLAGVAWSAGALAGWAVWAHNFWGVVAATVVAGYYNANGALYRFAAVDWWPPERRETAISWALAGGCLGAAVRALAGA